MPEHFDPYHKWLGIRPEEQPANHYRLLGLALFEDDADAIADAAEQRMVHVRNYQLGQHMALSQQILNELATARVCLLNPQKKAEYNRQLRATLAPKSPPVAPPAKSPVDAIPDMALAPTYKKHKKQTLPWMSWAVVGVGGFVAVVLLMLIANSGRDEQGISKAPIISKSLPPVPPKAEPTPKAEPKNVEPPKPAPKPEQETKAPPEPKVEPKSEPARPKAVVLEDPAPLPKVEAPKVEAPKVEETKSEPKSEIKPKLPIPDAAAQEKSLATIWDIYKDDYKKPDKAALAAKLLQRAEEIKDATDRFVLLQEARTLAVENWQGDLAFDAIDAMASKYDLSGPETKAEVIEQAARRPRITPEQKMAIAKAALQVVDEAVAQDNFDVAKKAGRLANQLARLLRKKELVQDVAATSKRVGVAVKGYADAQEAITTLKEKPDDPEANLIVGKYECFSKDEWDKGLPMLAKGSDEKLRALATKDIAGADSANEQAQLGDAWWHVSKERAEYWYGMALPGLVGLERDRVEKRIGSCRKYLADLTPMFFHIVGPVNTERDLKQYPHGRHVCGKELQHGLVAHPPTDKSSSRIVFDVSGFHQLAGAVGIADDATRAQSAMTFRIVGDGKLLWKSSPLQRNDVIEVFRVRIDHITELELFVDCPGSSWGCWAMWVDPVLTKGTVEERAGGTASKTVGGENRVIPPSRHSILVRPQNNLQIVVKDAQVFNEAMANQFPASQNKAGGGVLDASSKERDWGPKDAFSGSRTGHGCNLHAQGTFVATWAKPPTGRYILIFARTESGSGKGSDPWGTATISVNGGRAAPLVGMACQMVAIVDLGRVVSIQGIAISIQGDWNPGMAGIEIH